MKNDQDAFGEQLLAQYEHKTESAEIIERDDNFIDFGSEPGLYFTEYKDWSESEKYAVDCAKGKILDVGCGAGRHSLFLQSQGFEITGIDNSPGAIKTCKLRGLKKAMVRPIGEVDKFKANCFDTILMLGNNFGLLGSPQSAKIILTKFAQITSRSAQIIAGTRNPYRTDDEVHLQYHRLNRKRDRMAGQITIRVRYRKMVGEWFDYLFVSPKEMQDILDGTDWQINELLGTEDANYSALIGKRS